MKNIIGNKYGMLTAVARAGKIGTVQIIECLCDCGETCFVRYPNLVSGNTTSCGCAKSKSSSERFFKDLTGMVFGELTAIERFTEIGEGKKIKWLCECTCGSFCVCTGSNLKSGNTTSCGHLKASVNEGIIIHFLREEKILFEKEAKFEDLNTPKGRPLRFDFKIYTENGFFLLEYQGEQHFHPGGWDSIGRTQRDYTDKMKVDYCTKNNIELDFITYEEDTLNKLMYILEHHSVLHVNTVPSSENEKV